MLLSELSYCVLNQRLCAHCCKVFLQHYGNFSYGNCVPFLRSIVKGDRLISLAVTAYSVRKASRASIPRANSETVLQAKQPGIAQTNSDN